MPMFKPSVSQVTATVSATGDATSGGAEVVGLHYFNSTAGAGRIDIYDGTPTPGNRRVVLGSDAANGTDDYTPIQPIKFVTKMYVVFTTGTGLLTFTLS